jgi:hypothetical protein
MLLETEPRLRGSLSLSVIALTCSAVRIVRVTLFRPFASAAPWCRDSFSQPQSFAHPSVSPRTTLMVLTCSWPTPTSPEKLNGAASARSSPSFATGNFPTYGPSVGVDSFRFARQSDGYELRRQRFQAQNLRQSQEPIRTIAQEQKKSKIVLPCRLEFLRKGRSFSGPLRRRLMIQAGPPGRQYRGREYCANAAQNARIEQNVADRLPDYRL